MSLGGNITTTAIITNGLFCAPAKYSGIITTFFSLYIPHINDGGGFGAYYPKDAWNKVHDIQNFYKPYDEEWQYRRVEDYLTRKKKHVVLTIKFGELNHTKEFLVDEKHAKIVTKVGNLMNNTQAKIKVNVDSIRAYVKKMNVNISRVKAYIPRGK